LSKVVSFGIGRDYVSDWGIPEAIREIYQNFKDYGEFDVDSYDSPYGNIVRLSNTYVPEDLSIFKIGKSIKSEGSIGKYGEGLKLALLIMLRENRKCKVRSGNYLIEPIFINDDLLGEVLALQFRVLDNTKCFSVEFECTKDEWSQFDDTLIEDLDVLHEIYCGSLVDKEPGSVYVGGIFVSKLDGLNYAYNFDPEFVELERDRTIPRQFDVEYYASRILETYNKLKSDDLFTRDTAYIDKVPDKLVDKVKVGMSNGKITYQLDGKSLNTRVEDVVKKVPKIQKQVTKIKYRITRKRKPYSFLKDFKESHYSQLGCDGKTDFDVILNKSKNWS
jgi:hypothetical protein